MNATEIEIPDDSAIRHLRERGVAALAEYFDEHRDRLKLCVRARIDRRLAPRLDGSDVVQDTFVVAAERLDEYLQNPLMPVFLWLRFLTQQRAQALYQHHIKTQKRSPQREAAMGNPAIGNLVLELSESLVSPHSQLARKELRAQIHDLLTELSDHDREILTMVHLEGLRVPEAAEALQLKAETARKRHFRAMKRLRELIESMEAETDTPT